MRNAIEEAANQIIKSNPNISDADLWVAFVELNNINIANDTGTAIYDVYVQKNQIFSAATAYVNAPGIQYHTLLDKHKAQGQIVRRICR